MSNRPQPIWTITKLRGEFALTWKDGGIRRRYSLKTSDRQEAERRAPSEYARITRPSGTTVADLWAGYCNDRQGRVVVKNMKWSEKALRERFWAKEASAITVADCRAHTAERRAQGRHDGTIHTELGHLAIVVNWARKMQLIPQAPYIEKPPKPEPKMDYLTRDEVARMLAADIAPHIKLAILVLIGTGARVTAALELTWDRVNFETGMIALRNPFDQTRRKGRATVPMGDQLRAALSTSKEASLSPFVIEFAGKPVKSIKRGLSTAGRAIGKETVSAHMFRHSAAVWLAEDNNSMESIAQFLGHSNMAITYKTYARFSPNYMKGLAQSLEVPIYEVPAGSLNRQTGT